MTHPSPVRLVMSASGTRLRFADNSEAIDAMSSWWSAVHGYRHPALDAALARQVSRMSHVMFGGLTHEPAVELAQRLIDRTPHPLQHVFFADSGSVAVEVALKMCLQYARGTGKPHRRRMLTIRGGYYGDTLHPMSVCDPVGGMHSLFTGALPTQLFAPQPPTGFSRDANDPELVQWGNAVADLLCAHSDEIAGIIVEPIVQGAGGMSFYSPACLRILRKLADEYGVLLVFDEIATGFGRTGEYFALNHAQVVPDILCLGKALTGGYLTLAAVLTTSDVAMGVSAPEAGGALMHGPTFMANPLACAVACASLDELDVSDWRANVTRIEVGLRKGLSPLVDAPGVKDVRVQGAIGVVQLEGPVDVPAVTSTALAHGVWVRPFRDLVYTMPPYISTVDEVQQITHAICAAVTA